jgi:hypothetical protein
MTDHHDFGWDGHDDHHEPVPFDDPHPYPDDHPYGWDDAHEHAELPDVHEPGHAVPDPLEHVTGPHAADPDPLDAVTHPVHETAVLPDDAPVEVFPPAVDVGDLPEPVDGFPWIDTGSLGLVHAGPAADPAEPVQPHELAEYAATELPPAVDPWAALADSDDPATSALARWWSEN